MFKKISILLTLVLFLVANASIYSFDPKGSKDDHKKGPDYNTNHWLQGKEKIEKLNYDSLWNDAVSFEKSEAGQKLLENCINGYGGQEHLNKVKSLKLEFDLTVVLMNQQQQMTNEFQTGMKHKTVCSENGNFLFERVLNNDKSWKKITDSTFDILSHNYRKEVFDYLALTMPMGIKTETFSEIRYGKRTDDSLEYIYLKQDDSLIMTVGINPADNMIHKIEGIVFHNDKRYVFINLYSEFKDFNGYKFPAYKKHISMGLEVGKSVLNNVVVNPGYPENNFVLTK